MIVYLHSNQCNDFFATRTCEYSVTLCLSSLIVAASAIGKVGNVMNLNKGSMLFKYKPKECPQVGKQCRQAGMWRTNQ